jgi:hypothetical protein
MYKRDQRFFPGTGCGVQISERANNMRDLMKTRYKIMRIALEIIFLRPGIKEMFMYQAIRYDQLVDHMYFVTVVYLINLNH